MNESVVLELDVQTSKHLREHFVPLKNVEEQGFYRECISWDAFNKKNRNKTSKLHFIVRWKNDWELTNENWEKTCSKYGLETLKVPQIYHKSVTDFFDFIGYDRKTLRIKE